MLVVRSSVSWTSFFPLATFTRTREKDGRRREGEVGFWRLLLVSEIHAVPAGGGICVPLPLYLVRMADVGVGSQLSWSCTDMFAPKENGTLASPWPYSA